MCLLRIRESLLDMVIRNEEDVIRRRRGSVDGGVERIQQGETTTEKSRGEIKSRGSITDGSGGIGVLDILRVLGGLLLLNCALSWFITNDSVLWGYRPWFTRPDTLRAWWVCLQFSNYLFFRVGLLEEEQVLRVGMADMKLRQLERTNRPDRRGALAIRR